MKNNNEPIFDDFDYETRKCPCCNKIINEFVVAFPIIEAKILRKDSKEKIDYSSASPIFLCPECSSGGFVHNEEEARRFLSLPENEQYEGV